MKAALLLLLLPLAGCVAPTEPLPAPLFPPDDDFSFFTRYAWTNYVSPYACDQLLSPISQVGNATLEASNPEVRQLLRHSWAVLEWSDLPYPNGCGQPVYYLALENGTIAEVFPALTVYHSDWPAGIPLRPNQDGSWNGVPDMPEPTLAPGQNWTKMIPPPASECPMDPYAGVCPPPMEVRIRYENHGRWHVAPE